MLMYVVIVTEEKCEKHILISQYFSYEILEVTKATLVYCELINWSADFHTDLCSNAAVLMWKIKTLHENG